MTSRRHGVQNQNGSNQSRHWGGLGLGGPAKTEGSAFKVPEQTAAEEEPSPYLPMVVESHDQPAAAPDAASAKGADAKAAPAKARAKSRWLPLIGHWRPTRKQWIISGVAVVVLVAGVTGAWMFTHQPQPVAVKPKKQVAKKVVPPPIIYSTLTGLPVPDETVNQRPVTGVMIENSLDARPQSGLGEAGVVYEAIAEGGITRFLALFQDTAPADVGPIRSARPYYIQWLLGFDAAYAHVGGSPQALRDISNLGVKDMNQFANGTYYHRISTRDAPHNVYTAISTLNELEAAKGYTSAYTGFPRDKKDNPSKTPNAISIDFDISSDLYNPHYDYNAATNSYNRSEGGEPHLDANGSKQISPKVVIGMVLPFGRGEPHGSGYYSDYQVLGSGTAYIFQNGIVTTGTWTKSANNAQTTFTDAAGAPIPLAPGQTWISAVSGTSSVSYK